MSSARPKGGATAESLRRAETAEESSGGRRRLNLYASILAVRGQNCGFIVIDGASVLPDIVGVVDSAGKLLEFPLFDGCEQPHADFRRVGDLIQGNAAIAPNRGQPQNASFFWHRLVFPGGPDRPTGTFLVSCHYNTTSASDKLFFYGHLPSQLRRVYVGQPGRPGSGGAFPP